MQLSPNQSRQRLKWLALLKLARLPLPTHRWSSFNIVSQQQLAEACAMQSAFAGAVYAVESRM